MLNICILYDLTSRNAQTHLSTKNVHSHITHNTGNNPGWLAGERINNSGMAHSGILSNNKINRLRTSRHGFWNHKFKDRDKLRAFIRPVVETGEAYRDRCKVLVMLQG